jgi:spoIIIJ-associated protein
MTIRIEEKSLELAMVKAAGRLGVTQSDLGYRILSKTEGFFGLFGKKVSIEAWAKNKAVTRGFPTRVRDEVPSELQEDLRLFLSGIYSKMFGKTVEIKTRHDKNDRVIFDVRCEFLASQLKNSSKMAESFEHLLRKKPRDLRSELPFRIFVDANGTRLAKEKELVEQSLRKPKAGGSDLPQFL